MSASIKCRYGDTHTLKLWGSAKDQEYNTITEPANFQYFECLECETLVISPMLSEKLDAIYPKDYYSFSSENYDLLYKIKFLLDRVFIHKAMSHFQANAVNILDIGGGTGKLASVAREALAGIRAKTFVVDLDEKARRQAEMEGHIFACCTFETWQASEKMDLILAYNILEHVADPKAFLAKMSELLSEDGRIILQTPNYKSLDSKIFQTSYWGGLHTPRHFYIYSKESLNREISKLNLKVFRDSSTQAGHFWACSILGSLQKKSILKYKAPMYSRISYKILVAIFVIIDFLRLRFFTTSQQLLVLGK